MARSRYFGNPTVDGGRALATWSSPALRGFKEHELLRGIQTVDYELRLGDRFDHLAARFLGDDRYWWVIALANDIVYPFGIAPGTVLRIPVDVRQFLDRVIPT